MNNIASILILVFLAVTFLQSSHDKLFHWKENIYWLKVHFADTPLRNQVALALANLLILELVSAILCVVGIIELALNSGRIYGLYGSIFSCITFIMLLFGQRLAKDYDGARTIILYFIPTVMAVYWLN